MGDRARPERRAGQRRVARAVRTDGTLEMLDGDVSMLAQANLRGRVGEADEIAEVVLFLAGARSSSLDGHLVVASGGERSPMTA